MQIRFIRPLVITCAALLLCAPAASAQPRGAIPGDDLTEFLQVPLNGSKTAKNIQLATLQGSQVESTQCDVNDSSEHSVWFGFEVLPGQSAFIDLESGGSIINFGLSENNTVLMTLYRQEFLLVELECDFGNAAIRDLPLGPGTYRVRIAEDDPAALAGPSQYRLTIRARFLNHLLTDYEFDNNELGTVWKVKGAGNPPQIVRDCSISCIVTFSGAAKAKLMQTVAFDPAVVKFKKGDLLRGYFLIGETPAEGADVKLTIQITYSNGTPTTKVSATRYFVYPSTGVFNSFGYVFAEIANKSVKNIKFVISSPTAADTFGVENAFLSMLGETSVRDVPPPPGP